MMSKEIINEIFECRGFQLLKSEEFESFGDYILIYGNQNIQFRITSSKSYESLDIRSSKKECNDWYDLALVKSLIYNIENLNVYFSTIDYINFLKADFNLILDLFSLTNVSKTIQQLNLLEKKRVLQMFPPQ